jgi:hypothetical protein
MTSQERGGKGRGERSHAVFSHMEGKIW